MNPYRDNLFFVALWAWMRAHPGCEFDEFADTITRIIARIAQDRAQQEARQS